MHLTERLSFLDFSAEIRNEIYKYYFRLPGGYHFNIKSRRLVDQAGQLIDLSLRLTCQQIAAETISLTVGLNCIHFSTADDPEIWPWASRIGALMDYSYFNLQHMFIASRKLFTKDLRDEITKNFPQYTAMMDQIMVDHGILQLFEEEKDSTISTHHKFIVHALDVMSRQPGFLRAIARDADEYIVLGRNNVTAEDTLALRTVDFWKILEDPYLSYAWKIAGHASGDMGSFDRYRKFRFSATAVAISFLNNMCRDVRIHVTDIHLDEDLPSVSFPETHAQGLVRFCKENPRLRIRRNVSLWSNIFASADGGVTQRFLLRLSHPDPNLSPANENVRTNDFQTKARDLVWQWIAEVRALSAADVPMNRFKFTFDCQSIPGPSRRLFEEMLEETAMEIACARAYEQDVANGIERSASIHWETYLPWRQMNFWNEHEEFFSVLQEVIDGTCVVFCNFDIRPAQSTRSLLDDCATWSTQKWTQFYANWRTRKVDTTWLLLALSTLRANNILLEPHTTSKGLFAYRSYY